MLMQTARQSAAPISLGVQDFTVQQTRAGLFTENAVTPECDPRVQDEYRRLVRAEYPKDGEAAIHLCAGKYGFYRDWIDDERAGMNWAFSTPLVDICIGVSAQEFLSDLPQIRAESLEDGSDVILCDTFSFNNGYGDFAAGPLPANLKLLHSPVAAIDMSFETYLESLTTERRKKYRRMVSDFEPANLRFELSSDPLTSNELDFIRANLEKKWGSEAGYAYRQILWSLAVQKFRPAQHLIMRVYDHDKPVFIQTMIVKGDRVFCQSIAKDEDHFFSGLAAFTDFKCIEQLCGKPPFKIFDPSCRTGIEDPESIGIAKRATVNQTQVKPLLAIGAKFTGDIEAALALPCPYGKDV